MQRRLDRSIDRAIRLKCIVLRSQSVESGYARLLHARDSAKFTAVIALLCCCRFWISASQLMKGIYVDIVQSQSVWCLCSACMCSALCGEIPLICPEKLSK